jgi:hypothetical protein
MNWAIKHRKRKLHLELKERKIKDEKKMKSSLNKIQLIKAPLNFYVYMLDFFS